MSTLDIILIAAAALLLAVLVFLLIRVGRQRTQIHSRDLKLGELGKDLEYSRKEAETQRSAFEQRLAEQKEASDRAAEALSQSYEQRLAEQQEIHRNALKQQLEAVKAQISVESEKVLKAREDEFSKRAQASFSTITEDFNKNLKDMKDAFEANKKTQHDSSTELRMQLDDAVKHLRQQTENVGLKADKLASALRGQNKMQGCWGETQLHNILLAEGLVEGRDFDKEETLRDELGIAVHNEETGKRMRPDFILHYPDNTDIIVDCKVSLNALSDYFEASTDDERADASKRNLAAVLEQVEGLSRKDYTSYLRPGRKCLDYTVMFVPNVNALVLARQENPHILSDAFRKNVLITSEETLMPFLRLVRSAWVNFEQARNQEKIVAAASRMIDRVREFSDAYAAVGKNLNDALKSFDIGDRKLREGGQSIIKAAHDVEALGVKGKKDLPPVEGIIQIED
ncbi:MAG: DNA recombination protein RmuC [Bacteroidales bacterium]|nr:DNA recombination protein RmuC [Bacteroidales bacterium]